MDALRSRVRKIHVTLERPATTPGNPPPEWLDVRTAGNVISFVETQFTEAGANARVMATMSGVRNIAAEPIELVSIFTALARASRDRRAS
jgi:hypothetical protein